MITSKSPRDVAMVALAAGREAFSDYSHLYSPHKFTQPQLFACLVLKEFEKKDYRGVAQLLEDWPDLRRAIGLRSAPHFTTLQKASRRLLGQKRVRRLIGLTVRRIRKRSTRVKYAAVDSSGFDAHHASRYFILRTAVNKKDKEPKKKVGYRKYGKLMLVVCCATHAILAAVASAGPAPDVDQLGEILDRLPPCQRVLHMVADAGFDSASNHALLREDHGIRSTIPPEYGRPPKDPGTLPKDRYRRLMKTRFNTKAYRKRVQVETVNSMLKRNLGAALRGRSHHSRCRDLYLPVLTHNIALALLQVFNRAGYKPFPGRKRGGAKGGKKGVISLFRTHFLGYHPPMARKPRHAPGGIAYHVMNRASGDLELFAKDPDYAAFERVLAEALDREPAARLCAYCLMPNHFHLVLWPESDGTLSRFMQWLTMTHAARWHAHRHTGGRGHLYQSRFRSFPIQRDQHFLSVCRYVERNALRANKVERAQDWRWCSMWARSVADGPITRDLLSPWPVDRPSDWTTRVNRPQSDKELAALHLSRDRGRPYGDPRWAASTADRLGIQSSLRPIGRPPKPRDKAARAKHRA